MQLSNESDFENSNTETVSINLNNYEKENEGNQILIKTVQSSAFRILVEALKRYLTRCKY